jgi:DNA replication protein DnaC
MTSKTFSEQGIPKRYKEAHISKINQEIANIIKKSCEDKTLEKGLYIYGPVGVGKTYTAYAIYNYIKDLKLPIKMIKSSRIVEASKNSYYSSGYSEDVSENKEILKDVKEYKGVLIIDDIGSEKLTEASIASYLECVDSRYEWEYVTIFISNLSLDELKEKVGDRIVSRIYESSNIFLLEGASKRI